MYKFSMNTLPNMYLQIDRKMLKCIQKMPLDVAESRRQIVISLYIYLIYPTTSLEQTRKLPSRHAKSFKIWAFSHIFLKMWAFWRKCVHFHKKTRKMQLICIKHLPFHENVLCAFSCIFTENACIFIKQVF